MIYTYALCFVLALSSALGSQSQVDTLYDEISSAVVREMVQVAKAYKGTKTQELNTNLLNTANSALQKQGPKIIKLNKLVGDSTVVVKTLANKISHSQDLQDALPKGGKDAPRVIGAVVIGVTQIVSDFVKTLLTHY